MADSDRDIIVLEGKPVMITRRAALGTWDVVQVGKRPRRLCCDAGHRAKLLDFGRASHWLLLQQRAHSKELA